MRGIFPVQSLDRSQVHWEDHLAIMTPWEMHKGLWFKREDYFAPLGCGGLNGSKVRQLIWYVDRYRGGKTCIVTGASIQSPQLSSAAIVGAHYGLPVTEVVYSKPATLMRHDNPRIAHGFGADFLYAAGPYNPIIQRQVADEARRRAGAALTVEYGITLPHDRYPVAEVRAFHEVGARQVANMPDVIETLIVAAGSCNTLVSILLGLSADAKGLRKLFTLGVGPDKRAWARERLGLMGVTVGALPFQWEHVSLHDSGYAQYSDHFAGVSFDGIEFHPTYEAKMWRWLQETRAFAENPHLCGARVGFWIVGGPVKPAVLAPYFVRA